MSTLVLTNTYADGNTITASGQNTNESDIVTYINNLNSGASTWDALRVTTSSAVVAILNNSTGSSNILNCQDNGTNVFTVSDGGASVFTATAGGSSVALTVNNSTSTGDIFRLQDNGTTTWVLKDGGRVGHGLTSPSYYLDVLDPGTDGIVARFKNSSATNGQLGYLAIGTSTGDALIGHVDQSTDGNRYAFFGVGGDNVAAGTGIIVKKGGGVGIGTNAPTSTLHVSGGIQVGSPTGGDKGAGAINCAADIYKNNTAYTNPDYVLEWWATGKIERFKNNSGASDYPGIMRLDDLEAYIRSNYDLPRVKSLHIENGGQGVFARTDIALEKIEELSVYLIEIHKRLKELESCNK